MVPKGFLALVKEEILLNINKLATEHEDNIISCSDIFLPYVSDKTKKNGKIFVVSPSNSDKAPIYTPKVAEHT